MTDFIPRKADHIPEGKSGDYKIQKFEITQSGADFYNLQCAIKGLYQMRVHPGEYTKLIETGKALWMADTYWERFSNCYPVVEAHGNVLINGLGLGLVTEAILRKEEVKKLIVNEISEEVIKLVAPYLPKDDRLTINCADAYTWHPNGMRFNTIWHDIWSGYNEDTYKESKKLHYRYAHWLKRPFYQGSWARADYLLEREVKKQDFTL